jgi:hypothetical protein
MSPADAIVSRAAQLFAERLPAIEVPCECQFHRWLAKAGGDGDILSRAIERAAGKQKSEAKLFGREMTSDETIGFIVRVLRPPSKNQRRS